MSPLPNHLHAAHYQPPQQPLALPVCDSATLETDLAAAPVLGWFRVLVSWAQEGRVLDGPVVPRLTGDQAIELCGLLGCVEADEDLAASFADAALRWAMQARLLRLYGGILRSTKDAAELCREPALLWFRALTALIRPDTAFTAQVCEYAGCGYGGYPYDLMYSVGDFLEYCLPADARGESAKEPEATSARQERFGNTLRVVEWLAESLGLVTRTAGTDNADWKMTGLGRVMDALARLPSTELEDEKDGEIEDGTCLIEQPEGELEHWFIIKIALQVRGPVWRRLHLPGELTLEGLHLVIQTAFGWDGDHLHVFTAGPFKLASTWTGLDSTIPADLVTLTDLAALGLRELEYEYDLGDSWRHTVTIEKTLPPDSAQEPACTGGAGSTPPEDGAELIEDEDGDLTPDPDYTPRADHTYDRDRITANLLQLLSS